MSELTKLETLQKAVVDTAADYRCYKAAADLWNAAAVADGIESDAAYVADLAADNAGRAHAVWVKARLELSNYLKEQQDND